MREGWTTKRLGEIATIKPPKSEAKERVATDDLVSFLPMEDLGVAIKYPEPKQTKRLSDVVGSYTYFAEGDVLLAKITPCFENGKLGIAKRLKNGIGFGSSEFIVIRPDSTVSNEWLFYFLSRDDFRDEGAQCMGGAVGHQRVPKQFVEGYEIPIPPLAEQQRIVGILDEVFVGLAVAQANAAKNLQNARALFESHLQEVFYQRGKGWQKQSLESLCALFVDSAHRTPKYQENGIPALRPRDVVNGVLKLESASRVSEPEYDIQSKRHKPVPGDIVYSRELSYGWASLLPKAPRVCLSQGMCLFRPSERLNPHFLLYVLNGSIGREQAIRAAVGAAHPHINLSDIKSYRIPVPPGAEQKVIVAQLDALSAEIQRLTRIYEQKLAQLAALKKSLLHQAFNGQL